jgi:hypothetical protein
MTNPEALENLAKLMREAKSERAQAAAAGAILDRGCGKPTQPIEGQQNVIWHVRDQPMSEDECRFVSHVEDQWREVRTELLRQPVGIHLLAYTTEHSEAARDQDFGTTPANASRRAGDDDRFHKKAPCETSMMTLGFSA